MELDPIEGKIGERGAVLRVDARLWMRQAAAAERRPVTLGTLLPSRAGAILEEGFGWVWLRGIWDPGDAGRWIARRAAVLVERFREDLPDLVLDDIDGPALPPRAYRVREDLGGDEGLEVLRADLLERGIRLLLDFVPDCVAVDHPWVKEHPEFLLDAPGGGPCPEEPIARVAPATPGSPIDLRHPRVRELVAAELDRVASLAGGIYLGGSLAEGHAGSEPGEVPGSDEENEREPFWPQALRRLREKHPSLLIVGDPPALSAADEARPVEPAGALLDVELDHAFRELVLAGEARGIARSIEEGAQRPRARFLEEHGGPRAAELLPRAKQEAAAILTYLSASLPVFSQGEMEGRKRPWNPFLSRSANEEPDREILAFHERLLDVTARPAACGPCRVLELTEAWEGNETWRQIVVFSRGKLDGNLLLAAVNFGPLQAQCYARMDGLLGEGGDWLLQDLFSLQVYTRHRSDLSGRGLYLDLAPWDYNVFDITARPNP